MEIWLRVRTLNFFADDADDADADAPEPPARPLRRLTTSKFVRHGEKDDSDDETPREKKP